MKLTPRLLILLALGATGCSDQQKPPQITPVDGLPDGLEPELVREVAALDPRVDSDGDGLMDVDELVGWTIRVDETGRPQGILERDVASDPDMADTDGDGLFDGVERMVGADPDVTDTDGDGLNDHDEVQRWGTSPASVDSDGDSRGQFPDPSAAPDANLFDAAELQLVADPSNASAPKIAGPLATNPLQGDTDGDGVWDGAENATPTRSATLAETPQILVQLNPSSRAGFYLNLTITEGATRTEERGKDLGFGQGVSSNFTNTTTHTMTTWMDSSTRLGVQINIGANTKQTGADAGFYIEEEAGIGIKNRLATEFSLSGTVSTEFEQVINEVTSDGQTRQQTVDGGRIVMLVDVANIGKVPCKLRNLSFQLGRLDPEVGRTRPVAQLRPVQGADDDLVLAAGESVAVQIEARDVDADRMMALMANPGLMVLAPANYDVLSAGDEDYDFIEADVADRTARVFLEVQPGEPRLVDVAAQVGRDPAGREMGISVADVLDRLGITYDADPLPQDEALALQRYVFKIADRSTELYQGDPPALGDPRPYPPERDPGQRLIKRGWFTFIERRNGSYEFDEQLFRTRLLPGDRASLIFTEDGDRDGVSAAEERLRGTSDSELDTDRDGLSDWWEVKVGHTVDVDQQALQVTKSSPTEKDSDKDGLDDLGELAAGTHPWVADSDHDSVSNPAELAAQTDPLRYDGRAPAITNCGERGSDGRAAFTSFHVTDPDNDLVSIAIQWADGRTMTLSTAPTGDWRAKIAYVAEVGSINATDHRGIMSRIGCQL